MPPPTTGTSRPSLVQKVRRQTGVFELRAGFGESVGEPYGGGGRLRLPVVQKQHRDGGTSGLVRVIDERRAVGCVDVIHGLSASRRRSKSSAAWAARARISLRSPGKMRFSARPSVP